MRISDWSSDVCSSDLADEAAAGGALGAAAQEGVAADEAAPSAFGLLPRHGEAQASLERVVLLADVVAPVAVALFQAQCVHGVVAGETQAEGGAGFGQPLEDVGGEFGRHVQLPAEQTGRASGRGRGCKKV